MASKSSSSGSSSGKSTSSKTSTSGKTTTSGASTGGKTLKAWVTVKNGIISVAKSVKWVSAATMAWVAAKNAATAAKNATNWKTTTSKTPAVVKNTPRTSIVPEAPAVAEPVVETTNNVVKTDALQRRIDAKKTPVVLDQSQPTVHTNNEEQAAVNAQAQPQWDQPPEGYKYGDTMDSSTGKPELIKIEPVTAPDQGKVENDAAKAEADKVAADAANAKKLAEEAKANEKGEMKVPLTQDEAFAILQAGGKLEKTAQSAIYESRYKSYSAMNSIATSQLASLNASGKMAQWALDYLQKTNPTKFAELQELTNQKIAINNINQSSKRLYDKSTGKVVEKELSALEQAEAEINKTINTQPPSSRDLWQKHFENNQEIKGLAKQIAQKDWEIWEVEDAIEYQYDDMRGQFPNVPKAIMMGMVAAQTKELNRVLNTKLREKSILVAEHTAAREDAKAMMDFEMQVIAEERADRTEKLNWMKEKYSYLKKDEDWEKEKTYQTNAATIAYNRWEASMAKQHEWQLEAAKELQAFQKEESRLQREHAMKIVDKQMKKDWVDYNVIDGENWEKLVTWNDEVTWKPVFKKLEDFVQDEPAETVKVNGGNTTVNYWPDKNWTYWLDFDIEEWTTLKRPQCWMFYNDSTDREKPVGDSFFSKLLWVEKDWIKAKTDANGKIDTTWVKVGDAFVSSIGVTNKYDPKQYGHIGFVSKIFPDGSLEIQDSNGDGKWKFSKRVIRPWNSIYDSIEGFFSTKLSRDASQLGSKGNKSIDNDYMTIAWNNILQIKWTDSQKQINVNGFKDIVKTTGAGSDQVRTYVNNLIGSKLGNDKWSDVGQSINALQTIRDNMAAYQEKYGSEWFGTITNLDNKVKELKASLWKGDIQPWTREYDRIKMLSTTLQAMQTYRKEKTGAAASELESKEYRGLFPMWSDSANVSFAKIDGLLEGIKAREKSEQVSVLWGEREYNYFIKWQTPWSQPEEVSIASVVWDPKYPLSNEAQKTFWNNFQDPSWMPMNSLSEFMFGEDSSITKYFNQ